MEILSIIIEIIDRFVCMLGLCFGMAFILYSLYDMVMFIIIKIKYWWCLYENRKVNRRN